MHAEAFRSVRGAQLRVIEYVLSLMKGAKERPVRSQRGVSTQMLRKSTMIVFDTRDRFGNDIIDTIAYI